MPRFRSHDPGDQPERRRGERDRFAAGVLAAIDAEVLSCSAAYRYRLQGAVVALEALRRASRGAVHVS